jgi:hypothetical protein
VLRRLEGLAHSGEPQWPELWEQDWGLAWRAVDALGAEPLPELLASHLVSQRPDVLLAAGLLSRPHAAG